MTKRANPTAGKKAKASESTSASRATQASVLSLVPSPPSRDAIARRAFELYQQRDHAAGSELHDWLSAERELRHS